MLCVNQLAKLLLKLIYARVMFLKDGVELEGENDMGKKTRRNISVN